MTQLVEVIGEQLRPDFRAKAIVGMDSADAITIIFLEELLPRRLETNDCIEVGRCILSRWVLNSRFPQLPECYAVRSIESDPKVHASGIRKFPMCPRHLGLKKRSDTSK